MIDCRRAKQLLPLWIGQDLPDAACNADVAAHLADCPDCERERQSLQTSLDQLQSAALNSCPVELHCPSLWPALSTRISDWEGIHRRARFNGWIPASVMALAVALMVAVSLPSLHEEFFGPDATNWNTANRFYADPAFDLLRDPEDQQQPQHPPLATPVRHRIDSW